MPTSCKFLKLFTILPLDEIARLAALQGAEINEAKKVLATEATALLHGARGATRRPKQRARPSRKARSPTNLPTVRFRAANFEAGIGVLVAFVGRPRCIERRARRQIKGGGLRVNDVAVSDEKMVLNPSDLTPEGVIKLSLGRKRHVLLKPA